jgi:Flp pilus assembly protein TadG
MGKSARRHASCRRGKMKRNMAVKFALLLPVLAFLLAIMLAVARSE